MPFLFETARFVNAIVPINTTGATQTGLWVNMGYNRRCAMVFQGGAWAGGTAAVTVNQATDNTGTGTKAVAFGFTYRGTGGGQSGTGVSKLVKVTVTANTFNMSVANQFFVVDVHAQDMDLAGGFNWLGASIASPGANADLVSALYILYDSAGMTGLPSTMPEIL